MADTVLSRSFEDSFDLCNEAILSSYEAEMPILRDDRNTYLGSKTDIDEIKTMTWTMLQNVTILEKPMDKKEDSTARTSSVSERNEDEPFSAGLPQCLETSALNIPQQTHEAPSIDEVSNAGDPNSIEQSIEDRRAHIMDLINKAQMVFESHREKDLSSIQLLKEEVKRLNNEVWRKDDEIQEMSQEIMRKNYELNEKDAEISMMQEEIKFRNQETTTTLEDKKSEEMKQLQEQLIAEVVTLQDQNETKSKEIRRLRAANEEIRTKFYDKLSKCQKYEKEVKDLKAKISEYEGRKKSRCLRIQLLEFQIQRKLEATKTEKKQKHVVVYDEANIRSLLDNDNVQTIFLENRSDKEEVLPKIASECQKEMFIVVFNSCWSSDSLYGFSEEYANLLAICQVWKKLLPDGEIHVIAWGWNGWHVASPSKDLLSLFTSHKTLLLDYDIDEVKSAKDFKMNLPKFIAKEWPKHYDQLMSSDSKQT